MKDIPQLLVKKEKARSAPAVALNDLQNAKDAIQGCNELRANKVGTITGGRSLNNNGNRTAPR